MSAAAGALIEIECNEAQDEMTLESQRPASAKRCLGARKLNTFTRCSSDPEAPTDFSKDAKKLTSCSIKNFTLALLGLKMQRLSCPRPAIQDHCRSKLQRNWHQKPRNAVPVTLGSHSHRNQASVSNLHAGSLSWHKATSQKATMQAHDKTNS